MVEALPGEVREIAHKLSFLGNIPDNHKADVQRLVIHHKDSWHGTYHRTVNAVSRETTLADIRDIVDEALRLIKKYPSDQCVSFIISELNAAYTGGIKRMGATTYADDPNISSGLGTLSKEIKLHLENYKRFLKDDTVSPTRSTSYPIPTPTPTPAQWINTSGNRSKIYLVGTPNDTVEVMDTNNVLTSTQRISPSSLPKLHRSLSSPSNSP